MTPTPTESASHLGGMITGGMAPFTAIALVMCLALLVHLVAKKLADKWADRT